VMAANNEIGVLQPIEAIGRIARSRGVLFHTDASQAAGKVPFDVEQAKVDLASFTAHKMYGPKGVGALYVRRKTCDLPPLMHGGGQERGLRSGTLNVPAIVGFGAAAAICRGEMPTERGRLAALRDRLLDGLRASLDGIRVNGAMSPRLPQNLNVSFEGIESESLAMAIDDVAVSSGSACGTAKAEPSRVLKALGLDDELAIGSIRFGLGRWTTEEEVDYVVRKITLVILDLRRLRAALEA
jgi:cysteine desulfurase